MDEKSKRFLESALKRELLTKAQVEEAVRIYETVRDVGVEQMIQDIIVKKGFMSAEAVRSLRRQISGMRVGKYKIVEQIGEGGAGVVYRATQEPLDRTVAIKVLGKHRADSAEYLERFRREARVAVTLNHQNIVRGLDFGEADGYHYFVMEFVEGESLHDMLKREGVLEEKKSLKIVLQAVAALRHASEFNLVHRDIKPENILITGNGVAKVCDLGLAKPSILESARTTKDGATIGTPVYMSPEQIRGKDDTDFRADIYSLGVTLYEMVTGAPPFVAATTDEIVRKHIREAPVDPREKNLKLSSSLAAVILKMLAKKPEDRYASLKDLEEDMKAVLDGRPPRHTIELGGKRPSGKLRVDVDEGVSRRERFVERRKKSPILAVVALVVVGSIAAAAFILKPWESNESGPGETAPETANQAGAMPGPGPDDEAEELFREAVSYEEDNPGASIESRWDRYLLVERKFPRTRYAVQARDRLRALEAEKQTLARKRERSARAAYDDLKAELDALVRADRHAEALAKIDTYPEEFADTEYPRKLSPERNRIRTAARDRANKLLSEADRKMKLGRFTEAIRALEPLTRIGLPEIEEEVRKKVEEIRGAEKVESLARAQGHEIFRSVVGAAFQRAAVGEYSEAEEDLIKAMGRPKLTYFRNDLEAAWKDLRQSLRFTDALLDGTNTLKGKVERFTLISRGRKDAGGKVLGANRTGVRLARGSSEQLVPYRDLSGPDLVRLGFLDLDADRPEDHAAAALYLMVQGRLDQADREIEAARMLGADPAPLTARRELIGTYLLDRANALVKKAETHRERQRTREAVEILVEAVRLAPWSANCRAKLGQALLEAKRYADAVTELKEALALKTDAPEVHFFLAEALGNLTRPEESLKAYRMFVKLAQEDDPRRKEALARLAVLQEEVIKDIVRRKTREAKKALDDDEWDVAIRLYGEIHELAPNLEAVLYLRGKAYLGKRDYLPGYLLMKEYLAAEPSGRWASDAKRRVRSLERDYRQNIEADEFNQQGRASYDSGDYEEALDSFNLALTHAPLKSDAYYNRGETYLKIGEITWNDHDFEFALQDFTIVNRLDPDNKMVLVGQVLALYYLRRYEEATVKGKDAVRAMPGDWRSYNALGLVYLGAKEYLLAGRAYDRGLKVAPDIVTLRINRALAYEGALEYDKALAELEKASKLKDSGGYLDAIKQINERIRKAMEKM